MDNMDSNENVQEVYHQTINEKKNFYIIIKEDKYIRDHMMLE